MLYFEKLEQNYTFGKDEEETFLIFRAKVPGGWLVCMKQYNYNSDYSMSGATHMSFGYGWGYGWGYGGMTFVPDPNHEWDGDSLD